MRAAPLRDVLVLVVVGGLLGLGLARLAVALHVGRPQREVVPQQLHDERRVLVALLRQRVQLGDGIVERRLGQPARAVRAVQDLVVEYLQMFTRVTSTLTNTYMILSTGPVPTRRLPILNSLPSIKVTKFPITIN